MVYEQLNLSVPTMPGDFSSPRNFIESFVDFLSPVLRLHETGYGVQKGSKVDLARLVRIHGRSQRLQL